MSAPQPSPISFPIDVARLPKKGMPVRIEADPAQRKALAADHALEDVLSFSAELLVSPWKGDGVRVSGRVTASVVQACIVTLDPVPATVDEPVEGLFVPERSRLAQPMSSTGEMLLDPDGPDAPETFAGTTIDVGALAEEHFALGIDPYPRRNGAALALPEEATATPSPFARLGELARKR